MRIGMCGKYGFGKYGRAFLLGTSALVMTSAVAVSASFDINNTVNTTQTLNAGETGIVRPTGAITGVGLGVDILGSNATLTNQGTVSATGSGVSVSGPITGVTITNSGYISGTFGIKVGTNADVSGGIANTRHGLSCYEPFLTSAWHKRGSGFPSPCEVS